MAGITGLVLAMAIILPCSANSHKSARTAVKPPAPLLYAQRNDAMQLAQEIAKRNQLDPHWVQQTIGQAQMLPAVAKAVLPPPRTAPKNWTAYRARFIEPRRIRSGVTFYQQHRTTLERAEQQTGVPVAIILGVLGVETLYGQHMGAYRVLDALSTLAFDFPTAHPRAAQRTAFFKSELEAFLLLAHQSGRDPLSVRGSYAGAMGFPQFMPSSWRRYAVDFDGDSHIDLFQSPADAIGSIANYLKQFRWQAGQATHYAVQLAPNAEIETLLKPDIVPSFSVAHFQSLGAVLNASGQQHHGPLALIELKNGYASPSFVAGTENFYVITRYNWSSYYAMAVIELGDEVTKAYKAQSIMAK
jgi:membrane-bound lytic murein transglycosylase B